MLNWILFATACFCLMFLFRGALLKIFNTSAKDGQSNDPQQQYQDAKNAGSIPKKERKERSWDFLYEITDIVLNKFSPQDRSDVEEIGKTLSEHNMKYQHVVELGLSHGNSHQGQAKDQERGL